MPAVLQEVGDLQGRVHTLFQPPLLKRTKGFARFVLDSYNWQLQLRRTLNGCVVHQLSSTPNIIFGATVLPDGPLCRRNKKQTPP